MLKLTCQLSFMLQTRVLGLITKLITTPLWNVIEVKGVNVFDLNKDYLELSTVLDDPDSTTLFLNGCFNLFERRI